MSRLIICSFALLGVVFYEMSGGADFKTPVAPVVVAQAKDISTLRTASTVRVTTRIMPANTAVEPAIVAQIVTETKPVPDRVRTSLSQGLNLGSLAFPAVSTGQILTLASLEQGATSLTTIAANPTTTESIVSTSIVAPIADIRKVTGTRVNMRDGPGTIYPVLSRVKSGREVEVLSDSGTGWLRLRTLPDRQVGWISASLVSEAAR